MGVQVTQRGATRNQSTADYLVTKFLLRENRFITGTFKNNTGAPLDVQPFCLVIRDTSTPKGFLPAVTASNGLANVIGVAVLDSVVPALANNGTVNMTVVNMGAINGSLLSLPASTTLDTTVGAFALRDILAKLGLEVIDDTTENTKFDN